MNISLNVEFHFHEQEKASVFLESNSSDNDEKLGEVSLLTMFAIRMMSNLGVNQTTDQLATLLTGAPSVIRQLASGQTTGGLELIPYPGYQGRKRFLAQLKMSEQGGRLDFQAKGFGWFATGVGYYGPVAVFGLLRHLAMKQSDDSEFLVSLANAAAMAGQAQLGRQIGLTNHNHLGNMIVAQTCAQYMV